MGGSGSETRLEELVYLDGSLHGHVDYVLRGDAGGCAGHQPAHNYSYLEENLYILVNIIIELN